MTAPPPPAGLCDRCRHVSRNTTRRGTTYLRCTRAAWDDRLVRYPRLPVLSCVGHEDPVESGGRPESGDQRE